MTLSTFVEKVHYRHKGNSRFPTAGTDKYLKTVSIANDLIYQLATDDTQDWAFLYELRDIGTISSGDFSIDLDDDVHKLSDYVYAVEGDNLFPFNVVNPNSRTLYNDAVYVTGTDPQVITFHDNIATTSNMVGRTVRAGVYIIPEELENPTDVIPVNPQWLILATAAELARNDPAKDDQFGNLIGMANDLYEKMLMKNATSGYLQPNEINRPSTGFVLGENWSND